MTGLGASVMWDGYVKGREEGREEGWQSGHAEGWQSGREEGWQSGRQSGRAEGRELGLLSAARSLMRKHNLTAEQALEELDVPQADRADYLTKL